MLELLVGFFFGVFTTFFAWKSHGIGGNFFSSWHYSLLVMRKKSFVAEKLYIGTPSVTAVSKHGEKMRYLQNHRMDNAMMPLFW